MAKRLARLENIEAAVHQSEDIEDLKVCMYDCLDWPCETEAMTLRKSELAGLMAALASIPDSTRGDVVEIKGRDLLNESRYFIHDPGNKRNVPRSKGERKKNKRESVMSKMSEMSAEAARQIILTSVNRDIAHVESGPDLNDMKGTMSRMEDFRVNNNIGLTLTLMVGSDLKTGEMAAHFEVGGVAASMLLAGHLMPIVVSDHINRMSNSCGCENCVDLALVRAIEHMTGMTQEKPNG